jgi:hypothetical protein
MRLEGMPAGEDGTAVIDDAPVSGWSQLGLPDWITKQDALYLLVRSVREDTDDHEEIAAVIVGLSRAERELYIWQELLKDIQRAQRGYV